MRRVVSSYPSYFLRMKGGIIMGRRIKITLPENTQQEVKVGEKIVKIDDKP